MLGLFSNTVAALTADLAAEWEVPTELAPSSSIDRAEFVLTQLNRMPWYLGASVKFSTLLFALTGAVRDGRPFHRKSPDKRREYLERWANSRIAACRALVKFYASLTLLAVYSWPQSRSGMDD